VPLFRAVFPDLALYLKVVVSAAPDAETVLVLHATVQWWEVSMDLTQKSSVLLIFLFLNVLTLVVAKALSAYKILSTKEIIPLAY
jgi:hypothetical protein